MIGKLATLIITAAFLAFIGALIYTLVIYCSNDMCAVDRVLEVMLIRR